MIKIRLKETVKMLRENIWFRLFEEEHSIALVQSRKRNSRRAQYLPLKHIINH